MVEKIKTLLKEKAITTSQFCKDIGIAKNALSEWKSGRIKPNIDTVVKIANYLDVTTDYLLNVQTPSTSKLAIPSSIQNAVLGFQRRQGDFTDEDLNQIDTFFQVLEARHNQKRGV